MAELPDTQDYQSLEDRKRELNREACRRYRERNREKYRKLKLDYYHANREKRRAQAAEYYQRSKDIKNAERRERRARDPEYAEAFRKRNRKHRAANLAKERKRAAAKYRNGSPQYKLKHNSLASMRRSIRGKGGKRWHEAVGYTADDLKQHLERQFAKGMTWENYGTHWHVDHIVPVSSFDCSSVDDPAFKACWALSNLRPLWVKDNLSKNNKRTHLI